MKTWSLFALLLVGCAGVRTAARDGGFGYTEHPKPPPPPKPVSFSWVTDASWRKETIPFPLEFAPELPYRGLEEIRFAPGFFDPKAPGYWTYAFVWWIDETGPRLERATLEANLKDYFVGLTKAVAKDKFEPDLSRIGVHLEANVVPGLVGTARTIDAFKTHEEVTLNVHVKTGSCDDRRFVLMSLSPKAKSDPMWVQLNDIAAAFQCR